MSEFINTIDVLGDDAVMDSIINRTITEFKDNTLETVGAYAFYGCTALTSVNLPNCTEVLDYGISECAELSNIDLPAVTKIYGAFTIGCPLITTVELPSLRTSGMGAWSELNPPKKRIVLPSLRSLDNFSLTGLQQLEYFDCGATADGALWIGGSQNFQNCGQLKTLVLRHSSVATLGGAILGGTPIGKRTGGYIYVPRALIEDYKVATNWSNYADRFLVLEDHTVDGTITGEIRLYNVLYMLHEVICSNTERLTTSPGYHATLETNSGSPIASVMVTMNGEDVTSDVYNTETHEINIANVVGDIAIKASTGAMHDIMLTPVNGSLEGELPAYRLDVAAGTVLKITHYLTSTQGYVYQTESGAYYNGFNGATTNAEITKQVTVSTDSYIIFGSTTSYFSGNGNLAGYAGHRPYGRYIFVDIL